MRKLILVKHAPPLVMPGVPPEQWTLSEKGQALCVPLAERLRGYEPAVIFSSEEPKASQTAQLVAEHLGIPWRTGPGLHEHDRSNVPHMRSGEFISMMELFFRRPDERVLGEETAEQARSRFEAAVSKVLAEQPDGNIAIISHGTVIALMLQGDGDAPAVSDLAGDGITVVRDTVTPRFVRGAHVRSSQLNSIKAIKHPPETTGLACASGLTCCPRKRTGPGHTASRIFCPWHSLVNDTLRPAAQEC